VAQVSSENVTFSNVQDMPAAIVAPRMIDADSIAFAPRWRGLASPGVRQGREKNLAWRAASQIVCSQM
jgi:hypothetical protein